MTKQIIQIIALGVLSSCATVYHHSSGAARTCTDRFVLFQYFSGCVRHQLVGQVSTSEFKEITYMLRRLREQVDAGAVSDAEAKTTFIRYVTKRASQIDNARIKTGLAIGAVTLGVIAVAAAAESGGGAVSTPSTPVSNSYKGDQLNGCCSWHGGIAGIIGDRIQCRDGTLSLSCTIGGGKIINRNPSTDLRGCCSWHGGICGYMGSSVLCCDGKASPTCHAH